jgi:hypothetical protein
VAGVFWRREPLHERLAREGGLDAGEPPPHDTTPRWGEVGIHGVSRPRQWDAVVLANAPFEGEWLTFVALPNGRIVTNPEADVPVPPEAVAPMAAALETSVQPAYRAEAVRRGENRFAVAARRIEVAEVREQVDGDEIDLTYVDGERRLHINGVQSFGTIPSLERPAGERYANYSLRAERIEGSTWEVFLTPL